MLAIQRAIKGIGIWRYCKLTRGGEKTQPAIDLLFLFLPQLFTLSLPRFCTNLHARFFLNYILRIIVYRNMIILTVPNGSSGSSEALSIRGGSRILNVIVNKNKLRADICEPTGRFLYIDIFAHLSVIPVVHIKDLRGFSTCATGLFYRPTI